MAAFDGAKQKEKSAFDDDGGDLGSDMDEEGVQIVVENMDGIRARNVNFSVGMGANEMV